MFILSVILVIASGLTHAVWSLFAKKSGDRTVFLCLILVPTSLALLPSFVAEILQAHIPWQGYSLIGLSLLFQGAYALLLTETYKHGDLSQVYPVMRGTSTLLIPATGVLVFGETLSVPGWLGLVCIIFGFMTTSGWTNRNRAQPLTLKPLLLALSVGVCTSCYVLIDKLNLNYLSPLSLLEISNIGFMTALVPSVFASNRWKEEASRNWRLILLGSVLSPSSYLLFLVAMQFAPIAHISPIREIGIVFGTVLGLVVLKERQGTQRIVSAVMITFGIIMIGMFR